MSYEGGCNKRSLHVKKDALTSERSQQQQQQQQQQQARGKARGGSKGKGASTDRVL
jgi:hypothetical protein